MMSTEIIATSLEGVRRRVKPAIEAELQRYVNAAEEAGLAEMQHMLRFHLGWEGPGAGDKATGKRIRPLLVLLSCEAAGGAWQAALPAAAAVELLHNFSLIHDDIQDNSRTRRGRPTLWAQWGVAQAINAGDALFALAHVALEDLEDAVYPQAAKLLPRVSLELTQGQYLDLAYEDKPDLDASAYWPMVRGKTAVLLSACTRLGALVAGARDAQLNEYAHFGEKLGLAFQVYDDLLGIWGDEALTGKSAHSDLVSGKKSLPVLYALGRSEEFARRWNNGKIAAEEVADLAALLEAAGARQYVEGEARRLTKEALEALERAQPAAEATAALRELAEELVTREA
jgi:geranylgeranyl diphosphate synthase type I